MGKIRNLIGDFFKYTNIISTAKNQKKVDDKFHQKEKEIALHKESDSDRVIFPRSKVSLYKSARSKAIKRNIPTNTIRGELKEFGTFKAVRYSWYYPSKRRKII